MKRNECLTDSTLRHLYLEKGMSGSEIATHLKVSSTPVYNALKRFEIPRRVGHRKTILQTNVARAQRIVDLYEDFGLSTVQIAQRYGMSATNVSKYLRLMGTERRSPSEAAQERYRRELGFLPMTPYLGEVLTGELLGDGHLTEPTPRTSAFVYGTAQNGYIKWLVEKFKSLGLRGGDIQPTRSRRAFTWTSTSYPELRDLRLKWYPDGKKCVPFDTVLTPTVCFHWYIGDGSMDTHRYQRAIRLATCGFTWEDNDFLRSALQSLVGPVSVYSKKFPHKTYPYLYLTHSATLNFLDMVGPCPDELIPVYGYKWRENPRLKNAHKGVYCHRSPAPEPTEADTPTRQPQRCEQRR